MSQKPRLYGRERGRPMDKEVETLVATQCHLLTLTILHLY